MSTQSAPTSSCCPQFDPAPWQNKTFEWSNKKFIKDHVCTFFFMPVCFGKVMKRLEKNVKKAGADVPDWLCLSDHTSHWNMDLYLAVDKEVTGAENVNLSGKYYSKVYEGPFKDTEQWMKDFNKDVQSKGIKTGKIYMWYTTCPKCAKKYGKNYVVVIAELK